jgi:hypothetical protein
LKVDLNHKTKENAQLRAAIVRLSEGDSELETEYSKLEEYIISLSYETFIHQELPPSVDEFGRCSTAWLGLQRLREEV